MSYPAGLSSSSEGGSSLTSAKGIPKAVKDAILSFQAPGNHRRVPPPMSLLSEWGVRYEKDPDKMSAKDKAIKSTFNPG